MHSSWLRCGDVLKLASSGSVSVMNESSSDLHRFEKLFSGGALSRLHCIAIELLPIVENLTSVCVSCWLKIVVIKCVCMLLVGKAYLE